MKTFGQVGYEAYCAHTGWKSLVSGQPLPPWNQVKPEIQAAWEKSGEAMSQHMVLSQVMTCVYCGHEYPKGTPSSGADNKVLTDHIRQCEKHPMFKVRRALAKLVGAETKEELDGIESVLLMMDIPEAERTNTINAVHALRETL